MVQTEDFKKLGSSNFIKIRAFWDNAPCSLVVDRRFRGAYCFHHQDDEDFLPGGGSTHLSNVFYYETTRRIIPEGSNLNKI
jgi:hypothetical protein